MNFNVIFRIASGFGFLAVSRSMEGRGDVHAVMGDHQSALNMHLSALFMLVLAAICFITAGLKIMRGAKPPKQSAGPTYSSLAKSEPGSAFDADAALARYLEKKSLETPEPDTAEPSRPVPPRPGGFGRKSS